MEAERTKEDSGGGSSSPSLSSSTPDKDEADEVGMSSLSVSIDEDDEDIRLLLPLLLLRVAKACSPCARPARRSRSSAGTFPEWMASESSLPLGPATMLDTTFRRARTLLVPMEADMLSLASLRQVQPLLLAAAARRAMLPLGKGTGAGPRSVECLPS